QLLPRRGISHAISVVAYILDSTEVTEPDTEFRFWLADIVVLSCNRCQCKREVVRDDEHLVADSHVMGECPVILLVGRKVDLFCSHEVADVEGEVQADEACTKALVRVLG